MRYFSEQEAATLKAPAARLMRREGINPRDYPSARYSRDSSRGGNEICARGDAPHFSGLPRPKTRGSSRASPAVGGYSLFSVRKLRLPTGFVVSLSEARTELRARRFSLESVRQLSEEIRVFLLILWEAGFGKKIIYVILKSQRY